MKALNILRPVSKSSEETKVIIRSKNIFQMPEDAWWWVIRTEPLRGNVFCSHGWEVRKEMRCNAKGERNVEWWRCMHKPSLMNLTGFKTDSAAKQMCMVANQFVGEN